MRELLELALLSAQLAGEAILTHYENVRYINYKNDGSPLTEADSAAHNVIARNLKRSGITIVSEEGNDLHIDAKKYWLVDPLDGTKDFLAMNGEFTVNIALINEGRPVLGVVFAPAIQALYWGAEDTGSFLIEKNVTSRLYPKSKSNLCRMATSRFHDHPDINIFAKQNRLVDRIAVGSALKFGMLATADVDVYPRLVGSSEWDTAAGQAVLEAAGGQVLDWETGKTLKYGKSKRRNPRILAIRSPYFYEDFQLKKYKEALI